MRLTLLKSRQVGVERNIQCVLYKMHPSWRPTHTHTLQYTHLAHNAAKNLGRLTPHIQSTNNTPPASLPHLLDSKNPTQAILRVRQMHVQLMQLLQNTNNIPRACIPLVQGSN